MPAGRGGWGGLTALQKAALLLGLPAGATVLYILYRRYRESREEHLPFVGDEELEMEMRVPRAVVKSIIGRKGATIKTLRQETGARIDVQDEDEGDETTLLISGSPTRVCRAKATIHQIVTESTPVSEELCVPQRAVGRIIGRGGETVQGICRSSGAKVACGRRADADPALPRVIQLSGTQKQVAAAKKLILEKVAEEDPSWKELGEPALKWYQGKQPLGRRREPELIPGGEEEEEGGSSGGEGLLLAQADEEEEEEEEEGRNELDLLAAELEATVLKFEAPGPPLGFGTEEPLEVFVSAAENPRHFWVQLAGRHGRQLDRLMADMRQHYGNSGPAAELSAVQAGDMVAAPYMADGGWYRARVLGALQNGNLDLYYVDFGDNGEAPLQALRALGSDFRHLPCQAIECGLAGVAPAGAGWAEAALDAFDRLTYCAQWKPLVAKATGGDRPRPGPWPSVRLYDSHHGQDLDIGAELVRLGYAVAVPCGQEDEEGAVGDAPVTPALPAAPGDGEELLVTSP